MLVVSVHSERAVKSRELARSSEVLRTSSVSDCIRE